MLEENYCIDDDINTCMVEDQSEGFNTECSYFWKMLGVNEKSQESSTCSEIEEFLKFPQAKTDIDPLQWWFSNKFVLIMFVHLSLSYILKRIEIITKSNYCFFDID